MKIPQTPFQPRKPLYLRRCRRCSQFMHWFRASDGRARCQECGTWHEPVSAGPVVPAYART